MSACPECGDPDAYLSPFSGRWDCLSCQKADLATRVRRVLLRLGRQDLADDVGRLPRDELLEAVEWHVSNGFVEGPETELEELAELLEAWRRERAERAAESDLDLA